MQVYARREECKHIVWSGPVATTGALLTVRDELRGRSCPTCGEVVRKVDFVSIEGATSSFDETPAPRNADNKLKRASAADVKKTRRHLAVLGAETDGLAADLRDAALELTPASWRGTLAKIPVGRLHTYEPNAECIRFRDSPVPAIVFHQGLAGFLFKMNRSILPLVRMGSLGGGVIRFVEDEKTRSALRVQAVDTALEFLGVGPARSKTLVEIPPVARLLEMPLTRTMAAFLLCHEYGHAVLNHADDLRAAGSSGSRFSLLERSRAMEHEADVWGQDAVIGAFTQGKKLERSLAMLDEMFPGGGGAQLKSDISYAMPCVALLYFEFLDVIEQRLTGHGIGIGAASRGLGAFRRHARAQEATTHPSNQDRFRALYAHLSEHGNFTAHTWVEAFELILNESKDDLDKLIDRTGTLRGKRLSRRFWWKPRSKRTSVTWRDTVTELDDDDTRLRLQSALRAVEGNGTYLELDQAEVRRHFESQKTKAQDHFHNHRYAEAERIFTQILDAGETLESVPLYYLLGMAREQLGDEDGAVAAYRRCLELVPGSDYAAMCGLSLGRILLFDRNDVNGAEVALNAATTTTIPDLRAQATFWLGTIAHGRDDVEAALTAYREVYAMRGTALSIFPSVIGLAALNIGGVLETRGQYAEAAGMFEFARDNLAADPEQQAVAVRHLQAVRSR